VQPKPFLWRGDSTPPPGEGGGFLVESGLRVQQTPSTSSSDASSLATGSKR
jgi:hypothetical protein